MKLPLKKILITGNSGYIGSHLTKLLDGKFELYGIDTKNPLHQVTKHYKYDIRQEIPVNSIEFDCIIHLAALVNVGDSQKSPTDYYMTNFIGTLNVINKLKCKSFVFASTGAAEYCHSAYGTSKKAAEDCVKEWCNFKNIPYTIFRFYNVIGSDGYEPTNPDGLMYNLLKAKDTGEFTIYGNDYEQSSDGTCVRDYVHVMEVCEALKQAITKSSNSIECLGHGVGYTVKEMVNLFQKVNDVEFSINYGPRREGDLPSSVLEDVSPYMKTLYTIEDLLKINKSDTITT
jgi:UDP-glucose 4-epimerase